MNTRSDLPGPIRVLHIDDEPDIVELAAEFVERHDDRLTVETVTSGREGLDRLQETDFDCVVSDYDMPGIDGLELLDKVRDEYDDLPFLLYTGKGSEEVASEAIERGVTDYLQKGTGTEQYELLANRIFNAVQQYRATQRAQNLERIRTILRDVNQALVRAQTRDEIESRVCEIISEADPYRFAWIGEHDLDSKAVQPRAAAGIDDGYLDAIEVTIDENATGRGPTGRAIRTRELSAMQNILENDEYEPWREDAIRRGYRSSAAIPLVNNYTLYGVLNVYADRTHAFDDREKELLEELADDVANAISHAETRSQQRRYERIIENLPVGVYRATPGENGQVLDANHALAEMFGAESSSEMIGRGVTDFYKESEERVELSQQLQNEGVVHEVELSQETLTGDDIWVAVTAMRTEEDGEVYFDGVVRDITHRKERERQLRLFQNAVEASGHSIYFTEADGTIEYVNPAFEELTGFTADEAIGENPRILQSGEHDEEFYQEMWDTILSGEVWRNNLVNRSKSGDRYVVDQTIAPVEDDSGEIAYFVAVNADITEQQEREQELAQSRARWRALFENSPDAIAVHDGNGDIIEVNEQIVENTGYSREKLCSMNVAEFEVGHTRDELQEFWSNLDADERIKLEGEHRRKDGSTFPVEVWATKMEPEDEAQFIAHSRDITERKEYERELKRERERLEKIIDVVSHDLKTPLNVVEGHLHVLQDEYSSEHLDAVEPALERCKKLVEELSVFAHVGDQVREFDSVDLAEAVSDCWKTIVTKDTTLNIETDQVIRSDRDRLRHLLENIMKNAVEHGGPDVTVTVGDLEDGFYIEDDGTGIQADVREHMFDSGVSTTEHGTGLGLAIAKQVAEAHDWDINVIESSTDGARFEITSINR